MIDWHALIEHPGTLTLGWALLHSFWIAMLLSAGLWLVLRVMPDRPKHRYAACALALGAIPLMIVLALGLQQPWASTPAKAATPVAAPEIVADPSPADPRDIMTGLRANGEVAQPLATVPAVVDEPAEPIAPFADAKSPNHLARALPYLVLAYVMGLLLMSLRLVGGWWVTLGLRTKGLGALPESIAELAQRAQRQSGLRRVVRFALSDRVNTPCVVGILRPIVLLPAAVVTGLTPAQLSAVLLHELAHVRRHDVLVNLLQTLLETLLFYHPAVWWIGRQLRAERECCCDDAAVNRVGDRLGYVDALAAVAMLCKGRPRLSPAATGGVLHRRVRRLLAGGNSMGERSSAWGAGLLVMLILSVALTVIACAEDASPEDKTDRDAQIDTDAITSNDPSTPDETNSVGPPQPRILKIDNQKLKAGDMRYNVVIRPGDVISVPDPNLGFVYMMGKVRRPGAYTIPGPSELTLYRLIMSAGTIAEDGPLVASAQQSDPLYLDLVRTLPDGEQKIYHFNLKAIADGQASDIYLWPNDLINIGVVPRPEDEYVSPEAYDSNSRVRPIIDEPWEPAPLEGVTFSPITEADMTPSSTAYVIGRGDTVRVTVYELRIPGLDDIQDGQVSENGELRLAIIGSIRAEGCTVEQLASDIAKQLERDNTMRDATVQVQVLDSRANTYSVLASYTTTSGRPDLAPTRSGTYVVPKPDFRLIEALTIAGGVHRAISHIYVIRGAVSPDSAEQAKPDQDESSSSHPVDPQTNPESPRDFRLVEALTGPGVGSIPRRSSRVYTIRDDTLEPVDGD